MKNNFEEERDWVGMYFCDFGDYPGISMMQCGGFSDPQYIAMCRKCVERGTPVTDEDYDEFFPMEDGATY